MGSDEEPEIEALARQVEGLQADLADATRQLERFAYVASHDLKEPLRAVTGFARLLEQRHADSLDDSGRMYLGYVLDGAARLGAMIDALLDYSRAARHEVEPGPVDLEDLTRQVVAQLVDGGRGVDAHIELGDLPVVTTDEVLLRAVLRHLLDNALLYTAAGEPASVSVTASTPTAGEGPWTIEVRDRGIGIAPEDQDRAFDLFTRLQSREDYPGNGIGLGLVTTAVQRLGGRVELESTPGEGTVVRVHLPATP
ncbi:ATP-binding protein [Euzebya sp.]|uniref:sensor histidine kinase n=1 Tax=Euzebya sp. TaxID=1971409 RepID=UPI003517A259